MRYLFVLSILLLYIKPSYSTNINDLKSSLSGNVKNANTQMPLPGATITIPDLKLTTTSDDTGNYVFHNLPNGNIMVQISYVGYKSEIVTIFLNGKTIHDFFLSPSVVENENVTVTGVSSVTNLKHTPVQVSILSRKDLQQSMGVSLLEAVAKESGISIVTTGPAIAKPFIRGLGYNRVVTINDGVRQEGQQWGDEHGLEVDEYSTQKIEILRGPSSLMYGSDAIGGVINILTNTAVPNNTVQANLQSTFNSNNQMLGQYANIAGNVNGLNWNTYGSIKSAGDYKNKYDGNVLNSRFNEKNYGGYLGLNKSWGYSHLIFSQFDQKMGMIEGSRNSEGAFLQDGEVPSKSIANSKTPLDPWQHINHFKVALDNSFFLPTDGRITVLLAFQRNQRQEFGHDDHHDDPVSHHSDHDDEEPSAFFDLKTVNYNLAYHLPQKNYWKTSIGINGMQQHNQNKTEEAVIPDYHLFDWGIYGVTSKTWNRTTLSGGLRLDNRSIHSQSFVVDGEEKFSAFAKKFSNISSSIGATHSLNDHMLFKLNFSRGFRAPNLSELSANGQHEGTNRYEIGDRSLKSEVSAAIDGSIEITTNHIDISVSPYFNYIQNYIFYNSLLAGSGADSVINGIPAFKFNQQNARLMGFEARFDVHPHPLDWLHFENRVSFVKGRFTQAIDGSYNLPLIAPASLFTELRGEFPSVLKGRLSNSYARIEMNIVATQNNFFSGYKTETATNGYTLLNVGVGTDIFIYKQQKISFLLEVNNIGDVAYQSHLSRLKYADENPVTGRVGVFNMGRNFMARLIIPFQWKL